MNVPSEEDPFELQKELRNAKTFDFEGSADIDRSGTREWIEPGLDAKTYDLDKVTKTMKVRGFDLEEPDAP
ncbi:MAG: hypothetical protein U9R75_01640, partial [Candidatus Thermoplasmatota archaeon]|nr:hypothetical protein [Candidatus Thermoplasmatota archaeon]